jgi:hypothetical protein
LNAAAGYCRFFLAPLRELLLELAALPAALTLAFGMRWLAEAALADGSGV